MPEYQGSLNHIGDNDYVLANAQSAWVEYRDKVIFITGYAHLLNVEIFDKGSEADDPLVLLQVPFNNGE